LESAFPSGCVEVDLCWFAVTQQVLFAQQVALQACSAGALERMQERAPDAIGATTRVTPAATEIMILLNIESRYNTD
jgi:hypothetical protein